MSPAASTTPALQLVVFRLEDQRFGVELGRVERVLPMVAVEPFPRAPEIVTGVFAFHGQLVPVMDIRRRFRLPARAPRAADQLLVVRTARRRVALPVDSVEAVLAIEAAEVTAADELVPGLDYVRGVARVPEHGIVFVHDLDAFLSLDEAARLAAALAGDGA